MMNKFAEQLKTFRNQKGLSQEALAEQLNFSRQAISRWENGETSPDLDNLVKLASIFEVSLDELVTGTKPTPTSFLEQFKMMSLDNLIANIILILFCIVTFLTIFF